MTICLPAVAVPELLGLAAPDRLDELVCELLGRCVDDREAIGHHTMADGMQQVRLAQANAGVDEQRVVPDPWPLGDRQGCSVAQLVGAAHNEVFKRILGVQLRSAIR
jgi:hypothetical protein